METPEFLITTSCVCRDENGELSNACAGCWQLMLDDWEYDTTPLFEQASSTSKGYFFQLENLPLWNRKVSGIVQAKDALDLLRKCTVDSDWTLRYSVKDNELSASLSHHDCPTGGRITVRPLLSVPEDLF